MNTPLVPQSVLEHFGIAVAAITGVLAARGKRIDLFGVLVLALVTAYGGGTVRDLLMGDLPPVWLRSSAYLLNATLTALVTFFVVRLRSLPERVLLIADAFALALFTMIGVRKGITLDFTPSVAILLGIITGVAGGILRDVLLGEVPLVFRREINLYATAALGGAALYVGLDAAGTAEAIATTAGVILTLTLRLAGIRWKIGLPLLEAR
ncbi:MAG: trimeric intracellular cation channel family protein [Verrucomicrobia bacterium]|nr:trimeric intracellular cation channel family protein [Verrucomicrobiota bacterium]